MNQARKSILITSLATLMLLIGGFASSAGSTSSHLFKSLHIGFSVPGEYPIWVSSVKFDDAWSVPVGGIKNGVWGDGGGASVFDKPMPRTLSFEWEEQSTGNRYRIKLQFPEDLARRARALPDYYYVPDAKTRKKRKKSIELIVGVAPGREVTVWLSNTPYAKYKEGRVLDVIATGLGSPVEGN